LDAPSQLAERLAALPNLSLGDLRLEWRRQYRAEPPRLSRDITMRAIAYRLQEVAHGGLSRTTQRRLTALANEFETAGRIVSPPGPRIKTGRASFENGMVEPIPFASPMRASSLRERPIGL